MAREKGRKQENVGWQPTVVWQGAKPKRVGWQPTVVWMAKNLGQNQTESAGNRPRPERLKTGAVNVSERHTWKGEMEAEQDRLRERREQKKIYRFFFFFLQFWFFWAKIQ